MESRHRESTGMNWKEWILAVIGTLVIGILCAELDERDREKLTLPEITVHGHSSTN